MFRVSSTHLQEDIVVYKQHMVPSLCKRSDGTICCLYTTISSWRWVLDARNM